MVESTPGWLSNDFLSYCLRSEDGKQDIVVTGFTTSSVVPPGNNYGSCILRVKVEYKKFAEDNECHCVPLIVKSVLTEGVMKDHFDDIECVEPIFYQKFLPEARKFCNTCFAPKCFVSPEFSTVVLEDLKERGFLMVEKSKLLDFEHCRLYIIAAATLHAVSLAVHKENPELVESLGKEKLFSNALKGAEAFKNMIDNGFKCFAESTERIEKFRKYSSLIRSISECLWDIVVEAHKQSEVLNTINQGDPWITNMMFKYNCVGNVTEVKLLDFQALRYGSPVNDIAYFIWSSANHDVRRDRLDELYHLYLNTLNYKLKAFKCTERLSHKDFMNNLQQLYPLAIMMAGTFIPFLTDPTFTDVGPLLQKTKEGDDNPYEKLYNDSYCKKHLPHLLEQLESMGVFDYLEKCQK